MKMKTSEKIIKLKRKKYIMKMQDVRCKRGKCNLFE